MYYVGLNWILDADKNFGPLDFFLPAINATVFRNSNKIRFIPTNVHTTVNYEKGGQKYEIPCNLENNNEIHLLSKLKIWN